MLFAFEIRQLQVHHQMNMITMTPQHNHLMYAAYIKYQYHNHTHDIKQCFDVLLSVPDSFKECSLLFK